MAKQSGLGDNLYVGGVNLSGDIGSLGKISGSHKPIDVTGIDKSGHERIGGERDAAISFEAFFNPTAGQAHPTLSVLPNADTGVMYARGTALGNPGAAMIAKQVNYDPTLGTDGSLTFKVDTVSNGFGLEWGVLLTPGIRTDVAATNGTGVDTGVSAAFGLQAYLQVFSFAGTSVTIKIQDSADNISFADVTSAAFTAVTTAPGWQRLAVAGTVRQYLRAVTTGTFSSCGFSVLAVKNTTAVVF